MYWGKILLDSIRGLLLDNSGEGEGGVACRRDMSCLCFDYFFKHRHFHKILRRMTYLPPPLPIISSSIIEVVRDFYMDLLLKLYLSFALFVFNLFSVSVMVFWYSSANQRPLGLANLCIMYIKTKTNCPQNSN